NPGKMVMTVLEEAERLLANMSRGDSRRSLGQTKNRLRRLRLHGAEGAHPEPYIRAGLRVGGTGGGAPGPGPQGAGTVRNTAPLSGPPRTAGGSGGRSGRRLRHLLASGRDRPR